MTCDVCGGRCAAIVCHDCESRGVEWAIEWVFDLAAKGLGVERIADVVGASIESVNRIVCHQGALA